MDQLTIRLKLKPVSLNNAYKNNPKGGRSLSKTGAQFKKDMRNLTLGFKKEILKFRIGFNSDLHYLEVDYFFFLPAPYMLKKSGGVKARKADRCNLLKLPTDCLSDLLGIDDALILDGTPKKLLSPDSDFYMGFKIRRAPIERLHEISEKFSSEFGL